MQSYKSKKLFEKMQHFGLLDCIHSEGIFSGVKNAAVSEMKRCVFFIVRCFGFSGGTAKGRQSAAGCAAGKQNRLKGMCCSGGAETGRKQALKGKH